MPNDTDSSIIESYLEIAKQKKDQPAYADFMSFNISKNMIKHHFGGIERLHLYMNQEYSDELKKYFYHISTIKTTDSFDRNIFPARYVITTAVANSVAHTGFISTLRSYCAQHDAKLVILPCENTTNSFEKKNAVFDSVFNHSDFIMVTNDIDLNENFTLCSIQISSKQIKPITGLSRLGNREGSFVFASPKQFLEYVPSGNKRGSNFAIMTPGACTMPSYYNDNFISKRTSYIAEKDHTLGAIIVDIIDDRCFDFRQIQASEDGSFIDLGVLYLSNGSTQRVPANIVLGDLHGIHVDSLALEFFLEKFSTLDIQSIFVHDAFDGYSINRHIENNIIEKAKRSECKQDLISELKSTFLLLSYIDTKLTPKNLYIVKSNHDEFLNKYLQTGSYCFDPTNHYIALQIATAFFENEDILKRGFLVAGQKVPSHWNFLSRDDSVKIDTIECAAHGDLGINGSKSSLNSLEKIYGSCVVGHKHSPAIQRGVFVVGTLSKLDLGYNVGPSSWQHSCCLIYENGQRQLINYI